MSEWSAQLAAELPRDCGAQPDWFRALRQAGAEQFRTHGLPTRKDEAWKYTGLVKLEQHGAQLVKGIESGTGTSSFAIPLVTSGHLINMLDGRMLDTDPELPAGVTLLSLEDALGNGVNGLQSLLPLLRSGLNPPQKPIEISVLDMGAVNLKGVLQSKVATPGPIRRDDYFHLRQLL